MYMDTLDVKHKKTLKSWLLWVAVVMVTEGKDRKIE